MDTLPPTELFSDPLFEEERWHLVRKLKEMTHSDVMQLMKISKALAGTHMVRTEMWTKRHAPKNSKQAIHLFTGSVYDAFGGTQFTSKEYAYMQKNIRILSGMYGVIRPLDMIQPYRLEMGTKFSFVLKGVKYKNLYHYWSSVVTQHISNHKAQVIINLASEEYTRVINKKTCPRKFIGVEFLEKTGITHKQVTIYTKKARGALACWMVRNGCRTVEDLQDFRELGYTFSKQKSDDNTLVFIRKASWHLP